MEKKMMRCIRCEGRKKMYLMNGGYTHANMGGIHVDCPLCLGKGKIPILDDASEEIKKQANQIKDKKEKIIKEDKEHEKVKEKSE